MKLTNNHSLPDAFYRAVKNDPYSRGESDFSATSLANPPRANALIEQFKDTIEIDCSTRVDSTIGQGVHSLVERAARPGIDIKETRYYSKFEVDGKVYTISAQIDLFETDTGMLIDWKTTKAYAFSKKAGSGLKPDWISQMNIGCELMRRNELSPKSLHILALLKDWKKAESGTAGMPERAVLSVELPMWDRETTVKYIEDKIRLQVAARTELPLCSSSEAWGFRKCADWCDAKSVCTQYQQMIKTGLTKEVV